MLRQWIATACRTRRLARPRSEHSCRCAARPRLENLEHRLAMSSCSAGGIVDLNLIVVNKHGREVTVAPFQRHSTAAKRLQPDWIQGAPGEDVVRPSPDGLATKHPGRLFLKPM